MVAVDTGGTFTDAVVFEPSTGVVRSAKALTTYPDLSDGIVNSTEAASAALESAVSLKHGTTQVINALLQRDGAKVALITTAGFRDVLELRRGNRPVAFDLAYTPEEPLVPRELCFEVSERIAADGGIIAPLDEEEILRLADVFIAEGVGAIAVSFLNAYANPVHEQRAAELLRRALPDDVWVTTGSDASREWYEYERTSTAVANAFVAPRVSRYVSLLERRLADEGFSGALYLMASHGGVLPAREAALQPTALVESGPIGGVIGAGAFARALGIPTVLAFDMGGTTAKCAIVQDGAYDVVQTYYVGGYERGFPVRARVLDIVEVGSGGGSIASVDDEDRLSVGPRSAGSTPGPVAFGRGGTEPTVTDANLVLGRIAPGSFLDGSFELDLAGARAALLDKVARPLGYGGEDDLEAVALGVIEMTTLTMVSGIKQVSLNRGYDLRAIPLFVFGGGGPLHGVQLAEEVGASTVIIPPLAGNFSAVGMLMADARLDDVRTFNQPLADDFIVASRGPFDEMTEQARSRFTEAMSEQVAIEVQRFVGLRFAGQRHELNIPLLPDDDVPALRERYLSTYAHRFGHQSGDGSVEVTVLRSSVTAATDHLTPQGLASWAGQIGGGEEDDAPRRRVVFSSRVENEVPVVRREKLARGAARRGPALVEEYGSTTVIPPDWSVRVGEFGELWITRDDEGNEA